MDAFTDHVFQGNPAAVCPLESWLPDELLQSIAQENNLSETAFFVPTGKDFELRWFTPADEVDLCGHATLASAFVLFEHLSYRGPEISFKTRSGGLTVKRAANGLSMDFPATSPQACQPPPDLLAGLGAAPQEVLAAFDYVAVYGSESSVRDLVPDFAVLGGLDLRGVIATAPGEEADFVSRCFCPKLGVNEDPVTGSAHCELAPFWSQRLGRSRLQALQLSSRGGRIECEVKADRVFLTGRAVLYLEAEIIV
ncbi:MAG: PhzF family phenazine biosynthesis protein [Thermoleophilia bacterium]